MKQHYIYKGKNNGGLADLHNFISKDKNKYYGQFYESE